MKRLVLAVMTALLGVPLFLVVVLGDDAAPAAATAVIPGIGGGLRAGSVPAQYAALIEAAGSVCAAAPPAIIASQLHAESNFNPAAVSPSGAQGIAQFLPGTWPGYSKPGESPFDPKAAIPAQAKYDCAIARTMAAAQKRGTIPAGVDLTSLMLAGYNAGSGAVLAAHGIPSFAETRAYVQNIIADAPTYAGATGNLGGSAPAGTFAAAEIGAAQKFLGTTYAWNGGSYTGPTRGQCAGGGAENDCHKVGFDCSGLTMYAVYQASHGQIRLDHFADTQTRGGTPVPVTQLQPGDLISFTDPGTTVAHHIGIYLGNNQLLNAPESNTVVRVDSLATPYYRAQKWRAVRYGT